MAIFVERKVLERDSFKVVGVMSGSSMDGLDLACVEFKEKKEEVGLKLRWELLTSKCTPMPDSIQIRLKGLNVRNADEVGMADLELGKWIGQVVADFLSHTQNSSDLIAVHGHTLLHDPSNAISIQLGRGEVIAGICGIPVVTNFREADMKEGGQGAPMAPLADRDLFQGYDVYLNLGGIANITCIQHQKIIGYDLCPCNQLLNYLSGRIGKEFDEHGALARNGELVDRFLTFLESFDFYRQSPPKSLDNTVILKKVLEPSLAFSEDIPDLLYTAVIHICRILTEEIVNNFNLSGKKSFKVFVSGGGVYNTFLIETLKRNVPTEVDIIIPNNEIIDFKEAILIAYAGLLKLQNKPNFIRTVTGAAIDVSGGDLVYP